MQQLHLPDSLWAATAQPGPATTPLSESIKVDVAIIGTGFNGLRDNRIDKFYPMDILFRTHVG